MNTKPKYYIIILVLAALVLPLSWANAQTAPYYQFNNSPNNTVGGSPVTLSGIGIAPGGSVTISLQVAWPSNATNTGGVDYWLSQASGPTAGAFSLTAQDFTGSTFSANTTPQATSSADARSNSANSATPDGIPDNQLKPQNGWDIGSTTTNGLGLAAGTYQLANLTFSIAANAAPGVYEIRTFDYSPFGIHDQTPTRQADIFINVVPEPATLSLLGLGVLGALGLSLLRARRLVS